MDDDRTLFLLWREGDRQAGSVLLERHLRSLHRFFGNKLSSFHELEELVQQTMVASVDASARFRGEGSFRAFLLGIARNVLLKHLRDRKTHQEFDSSAVSVADCGQGLGVGLDAKREQRLLLEALRYIPVDDQVVLELSYWESMTAPQIAEVLEETVPAVRARLRRATGRLRAAMQTLAAEPALLQSTTDDLDRWAASLQGYWDPGGRGPG
ncbi:MAG: sigma-70 family RNA polymerase sigma factor [Nannocystaceae bacterium]